MTRENDLTPPELREQVDDLVERLMRQAGVHARPKRPLSSEEVEKRLRLIRAQAESQRRGR